MHQSSLPLDLVPAEVGLLGQKELPPLVAAGKFPPRYNLHKYWGKKPGNVVAAYIHHYSDPGGTVMDFFAGSGVVACEAAIAHRHAVTFEINPAANLITRTLLDGPASEQLESAGEKLLKSLSELREALFSIECAECGRVAEVVSTSFNGEDPFRVTISCSSCGTCEQAPSSSDRRHAGVGIPSPLSFPDDEVPNGWEMQKILRAGVRRWSQLFTPRNLVAVAAIREHISRIQDERIQRALLVTFTAHLAQATKMIADFRGTAGGPSWKLNCYWLPKKWQELNPFRYFANRLRKSKAALLDMRQQLGRELKEGRDFKGFTAPAASIPAYIRPGDVQYIFTDPPYGGEGIQYGELSMLWNLWLGTPMDIENEVAFNPYRGNDHAAYARGLTESFGAAHGVLASGGWMSVTFANKDTGIWNALIDACKNSGFTLKTVVPTSQSASNITNKMTMGAPKTDLILNFEKPRRRRVSHPRSGNFNLEVFLNEEVHRFLSAHESFRTSDLYDRLVIRWLTFKYASENEAPMNSFTIYDVERLLLNEPAVRQLRDPEDKKSTDKIWVRKGKT